MIEDHLWEKIGEVLVDPCHVCLKPDRDCCGTLFGGFGGDGVYVVEALKDDRGRVLEIRMKFSWVEGRR